MKRNVLLLSFCVSVLTAFSGHGQQKIKNLDSATHNFTGFLSPVLSGDTIAVPLVIENPLFYNYNFTYKKRLDSIQKDIPLSYNEAVQKYIDVYSGRKDMMGKMLGLSEYYFPIFENALKAYNVPLELKYLPIIESSMNSHAISRVGATGLWQFMFSTAKGYGLSIDNFVDERKDPIQASYAAAAYFRDAYAELGDWLLAIAAYNCGTGNVNRAINKAHSRDFWEIRPFLPMETRNYVPAFIAAIYVMNCPDKHQIKAQQSAFSLKTDTVQVNKFISLSDIANALSIQEDEICNLNPSYKKKIVNGSPELPKRIIMPKVSLANFAMIYEVLNNNSNTEMETRIVQAANDDRRTLRTLRTPRASRALGTPGGAKSIVVPKPSIVYHKVGSGQNLSSIAEQYNVEVQDLKVWNKLKNNSIVPGQKLIVARRAAADENAAPKAAKKYISYKSKGLRNNRDTGKI